MLVKRHSYYNAVNRIVKLKTDSENLMPWRL
jgi:hypothetical protein